MQEFEKLSIVLASASPRRAQLLEIAGFKFKIRTREVDESYPSDLSPGEVAAFLAVKKANAQKDLMENADEIILAADSVVVLGNTILGKPQSREEAFTMIKALSGKSHEVITGVCLYSNDKQEVFSNISKVYMDTLTEAEIAYYIDNYKPYDKAGSYGIQEWIGLTRIIGIEGSYSNIMGLPMHAIYEKLQLFILR